MLLAGVAQAATVSVVASEQPKAAAKVEDTSPIVVPPVVVAEAEDSETTNVKITQPAAKSLVTEEDTLLKGARECTRIMPGQEQKYNIPQHLLMAIGSNESGRYHDGLKAVVPWPWTVNAAGKGFYFASKQEAIAAVRRFQSEGIQSIDVGCMQVNLKHHAQAFTSLQNAFDPESNVAYASRFLRTNYEATHSWMKAVAYYHSQTPKYGTPYAQAVYKRWGMVLDRAHLSPAAVMAAAGAAASTQEIASLQMDMNKPAVARASSITHGKTGLQLGHRETTRAQNIRAEAPKMRVIKVYKDHAEPQLASLSQKGVHVTAPSADSAEVSAVSSMIIQDIAEAQSAYGKLAPAAAPPTTQKERGVSVTRGPSPTGGQFSPRGAAQVSSADDNSFVIGR